MSNELVTDAEVEKALDWLRDNANEMGEAKAMAIKSERMTKHVRALLMKEHAALPVSAQEREALADGRYVAALDAEAAAAGEYEKMRSLREAAALKIEVWRSAGANYRAMKI